MPRLPRSPPVAKPARSRVARGREPNAHFTHFDASGGAHMVDVGGKPVTRRMARAAGRIVMHAQTLEL
ncbi:MAG: cyclic pyranopterin monophosphate synthase MoaC, partial [Casimicrobiaceae bacterium]